MKQGLRFTMAVEFDIDLDTVKKIEFLFKQKGNSSDTALKTATYPEDATRKGTENIILIPWSQEETYRFSSGKSFYLDTRITLNDTDNQPETNIVELAMNPIFSYSGDGSTTKRDISCGNANGYLESRALLITSENHIGFATGNGGLFFNLSNGTSTTFTRSEVEFDDELGYLTIKTDDEAVNKSGTTYTCSAL